MTTSRAYRLSRAQAHLSRDQRIATGDAMGKSRANVPLEVSSRYAGDVE